MVECMCIFDGKKPQEIPQGKWIKKWERYHVDYTFHAMPQNVLTFQLNEVDLDESCDPYVGFLASRFVFTPENFLKLQKLIKDCTDSDFSIDELLEQTRVIKKEDINELQSA